MQRASPFAALCYVTPSSSSLGRHRVCVGGAWPARRVPLSQLCAQCRCRRRWWPAAPPHACALCCRPMPPCVCARVRVCSCAQVVVASGTMPPAHTAGARVRASRRARHDCAQAAASARSAAAPQVAGGHCHNTCQLSMQHHTTPIVADSSCGSSVTHAVWAPLPSTPGGPAVSRVVARAKSMVASPFHHTHTVH